MLEYIISKNDPGAHFKTISEAILALPDDLNEEVTLLIHPGIYKEKLTINHSNLTLLGTGKAPGDTVLCFDDYAFSIMDDGSKRGTFRSYSVFVDAHDVTLKNLTVENTSGDETVVGQAIALYVDGDRFKCIDCHLLGRQDTLFTGPLPEKELQPGGFVGPKQFAPRINGRHYYKNCTICGNIDFIFGSATAFFDHCTIESLKHRDDQTIQGYVTAPSTPQNQAYGYVFSNCSFISSQCPKASVYLGRPWRDYAKCVFLHCTVGPHIHPDVFHDWGKPDARKNSYFGAYLLTDTCGKLITPKAEFTRTLSDDADDYYSLKAVLGGTDNWQP